MKEKLTEKEVIEYLDLWEDYNKIDVLPPEKYLSRHERFWNNLMERTGCGYDTEIIKEGEEYFIVSISEGREYNVEID